MPAESTLRRRWQKENNPELYNVYLERQREAYKKRSEEKKRKWKEEPHTPAEIKEYNDKKEARRAIERARYRRKKGGCQTQTSSVSVTPSRPKGKRPRDMTPDELRAYKTAQRRLQRAALSPTKKKMIQKKRGPRKKTSHQKQTAIRFSFVEKKKPPTVKETVQVKLKTLGGKIHFAQQCVDKLYDSLEFKPMDFNCVNVALDNMLLSFDEFVTHFDAVCPDLKEQVQTHKSVSQGVTSLIPSSTVATSHTVSSKDTGNKEIVEAVNVTSGDKAKELELECIAVERFQKLEYQVEQSVSDTDACKKKLTSLEEELKAMKVEIESKEDSEKKSKNNQSVNGRIDKLEARLETTESDTVSCKDRLTCVEEQLKSVEPVSDGDRDEEMKGLKLQVTNLDSLTKNGLM